MSNKHNPAEFTALFKSIGLTDSKAAEAAKSAKSAAILKELIESDATVAAGVEEKKANLIVSLSSSLSKAGNVGAQERDFVLAKILDGSLKTVDQVSGEPYRCCFPSIHCSRLYSAAVKYAETHNIPIDEAEFDKECGVGKRLFFATAIHWV